MLIKYNNKHNLSDHHHSLFDHHHNLFNHHYLKDFFNDDSFLDHCEKPKTNIKEDKDNYYLYIDLPGMKKEDINIEIKDKVLIVSGERSISKAQEGENYLSKEIRQGKFERSWTISDSINSENIEAKMKDGILKITLNKKEELKAKKIEVK